MRVEEKKKLKRVKGRAEEIEKWEMSFEIASKCVIIASKSNFTEIQAREFPRGVPRIPIIREYEYRVRNVRKKN